ncbi:hypothetical protein M2138_000615 [Dysgonomonadaceae bacterium PH5-43]|nr:hypothetical protein [Dysgonomonadaceae bacterium PH5-43]
MNVIRKIVVLIIISLSSVSLCAQNDLNINSIFEEYGKQKGSILIELGKDVLGKHTKISRYKSLIMSLDKDAVKLTQEAILKDVEKGTIVVESQKDGNIETAYYYLPKKKDSDYYEYILYSNKSKKMTLIYLRGKFPPRDLEKEFNKLKNLLITVNNKQIKL